ncbi:PDZ and LIM domain protein 5 isoform X2 [Bombina bombina]|uniref:PDZ and LIM domain protein 5 isoform X2 n=1 Tax=Bombina bombina TaxID=8345 RepID=UPI00235ADB41|nr:PDZ and LIM domain protein 5 isoform X2 [Bombina bombina]
MSNYNVTLVGPAPWGFRLQGGKDFNMPLTISRLNDGGKAAQANIGIGDLVLTIDGISTDGMTHLEAQNKIKACSGSLRLTLQKATPKPSPNPAQTITSTNVAYNKAPRPFGAVSSSKTASIPSASSAFTPASASRLSQASPQPTALSLLAAVSPPPPSAPGLHTNYKPTTDVQPPALSATKPAVNIPRQPASYSSTNNQFANAQDGVDAQRRGQNGNQNGPPRKHIMDTYSDFQHTPSYSENSKQRLIDDTEDWHPRTGTTQSRSFRILAQMTGTENMNEPEEPENANKPNSDSQEPVQMTAYTAASAKSMPASYKSPQAYKPSGTTGVSKPATVQPAAQPVPSFGKISNNSATTVKSDVSNKSVGPPPPADQDTLFQRAEHIPAGKRTPMCAICDLVIRGPFLLALGKSWHKEEFNCAHCKINMAEMGFVQEKGSLYCEVCYAKFFAPDCARCQRKILGEVINALKQAWHVSCFVCVACNKPIRNGVFHLEDGEPYCETDYYSMFGTMCHGCEFPVEAGDRFLEALGHTWHNTCFVCTVCCESLEGKTFFSKKDKPLCKKHAHVVNI